MTSIAAPDDEALLAILAPTFEHRSVASLVRRPYRYATSFPLEELELTFDDGGEVALIFKDLAWDRLHDDARGSKPRFLYEPRRDIDTYRRILTPAAIGPRCYAAVSQTDPPRRWLFLEKVPGVELWQVGELDVWGAVAAWLGRFHARFAGQMAQLRAANPFLLECDSEWFALWCDRARDRLTESPDHRAPMLLAALARYDAVVDSLTELPVTLVHGEFYPSNILVDLSLTEPRVCPIDWEMAATGPGLLDLAALSAGWDGATRELLVESYRAGLAEDGGRVAPLDQMLVDLDRCQLHLALQWLGWARGWSAPAEHARDWIGEALVLADRLEL